MSSADGFGSQQRYYTPTAMRGGAASSSSVDSEDRVDDGKCSPYQNLRNGLQKVNIGGVGSGGIVHTSEGLHQRYHKSANGQPPAVGVQTTTSAVSNAQYTVLLLAIVLSFVFVCLL
jgi:hypothetical protein